MTLSGNSVTRCLSLPEAPFEDMPALIAGLAPGTSRDEIGRAVSPAGPIECSPAVTATTPSTDSSKGQDQWPDTGPCAIL